MRPIPKTLLIHTVLCKDVISQDEWGNEEYSEPVTLKHVRLEPSTKYVRDKQNHEIQLAAVMFYDCKNSRPVNQPFHDNHVIAFNGETYRVQLVEPLFDRNRLHHYELGLIRHA